MADRVLGHKAHFVRIINCVCLWACVSCDGSHDLYANPPETPGVQTGSGDCVCPSRPGPEPAVLRTTVQPSAGADEVNSQERMP